MRSVTRIAHCLLESQYAVACLNNLLEIEKYEANLFHSWQFEEKHDARYPHTASKKVGDVAWWMCGIHAPTSKRRVTQRQSVLLPYTAVHRASKIDKE